MFCSLLCDRPLPHLSPATEPVPSENAVLKTAGLKPYLRPLGFSLQFLQDRADIDISGPEFNFFAPSAFMMSDMHVRTSPAATEIATDLLPFNLAPTEPKVIF
jgi:hypothetical protein